MGSDYPRIQGFHLLDGVGVLGWIHSYLMEQAPSKRLNEILAISSEGSRVLETLGGVFLTFLAAKMLWVRGVSEMEPCSWVNFAKNAYFLCSYRSRQSLRTRMLEDRLLVGCGKRGGPWKSLRSDQQGALRPGEGLLGGSPEAIWGRPSTCES